MQQYDIMTKGKALKGKLYLIKRLLSVLLVAIMAFTIVAGTVSSVSASAYEEKRDEAFNKNTAGTEKNLKSLSEIREEIKNS